jgi:hypothetical protein
LFPFCERRGCIKLNGTGFVFGHGRSIAKARDSCQSIGPVTNHPVAVTVAAP